MYRAQNLECPRCREVMTPFNNIINKRLIKCGACGGNWTTLAEFKDLLHEMSPEYELVLSTAVSGHGELKCPECQVAMVRILVDGLELDQCWDHGVWFDFEELQQALRLV